VQPNDIMELDDLRKKIDETDEKILSLINRRYEFVHEIGKWKKSRSHEIYVPEREKNLFNRLERLNNGLLQTKTLRAIYREIMSGALALEHPLSVVYHGTETSFARQAALGKFGKNVNCISRKSLKRVFSDVANGHANYGIVPIENSLEGVYAKTVDEFIESSVLICAEINVRFHLNLLSTSKELSEIETIYAPSKNLENCSAWINENLNDIKKTNVTTEEKAAELIQLNPKSAFIGNSIFADVYKFNLLSEDIDDHLNNITRFLIIGKQTPQSTGDDKTTICFLVNNRAGALCDALLPFKERNIPITMLESRPSQSNNWEYYFYLDYLGHISEPHFQDALKKLNKICLSLKVLGSYPTSNDIL
jgi:chorismate mutase / prephenate dehydratase